MVSEKKQRVPSSKLKQPVPNRTASALNHRRVDHVKDSTVEDDWACDVEKAIKAAMNSTNSGQVLNVGTNADCGDTGKAEDEDERKSRRKKRKKKHREDDEERKETKVNLKKWLGSVLLIHSIN
jgi:Mg-chelatase subunit ChlI